MTSEGLHVEDLQIEYGREHRVRAVDGVGFDVAPGERIGLVGESGCGKSTIARALVRLLPRSGDIVGGRVLWNGRDLTAMSERELSTVRWSEISIVPQSSMNCFNPVQRVGHQIAEAIRAHAPRRPSRAAVQARSRELCDVVGIDPSRLDSYPHELSGGMRQRMVLAMALALHPRLIIADEPTTGLDVIVQDRILSQLATLQREQGFAMILVTHDIGVVAETCDRVVVMYAGKIVEIGATRAVLSAPSHPYTIGLKRAFPELRNRDPLVSIPGHPPALDEMPTGCRFAPRCPFATDLCVAEAPPLRPASDGRLVACHYADRAEELRAQAKDATLWQAKVPEPIGDVA